MNLLWLVVPLVVGVRLCARRRGKVEAVAPFEAKYPLDAVVDESAENRARGVVEEDTPEGRVRLRMSEEVFEYWADKAVAYRYLETVARKYVIVYDCRDQYVNMFRELLKAYEAPPPPPPKPLNAVFATFKVYAPQARAKLVNERANRYSWRGRIPVEVVQREAPKDVSYAAFKKLN